jgi:hypothetical protein
MNHREREKKEENFPNLAEILHTQGGWQKFQEGDGGNFCMWLVEKFEIN